MSLWNPYQQLNIPEQHYNSSYVYSPSDADSSAASSYASVNNSVSDAHLRVPIHPTSLDYLNNSATSLYQYSEAQIHQEARSSSVNSSEFSSSDLDSTSPVTSPAYNQKCLKNSKLSPYYYNPYGHNVHSQGQNAYNAYYSNYYYNLQQQRQHYNHQDLAQKEQNLKDNFEHLSKNLYQNYSENVSSYQTEKPQITNEAPAPSYYNQAQPTDEMQRNPIKEPPKPYENVDDTIPIVKNINRTETAHIINCNSINFKYPVTMKSNPNIKINLQDQDLWNQFKQIGTEMIITKTGRRMFPTMRLNVTGLESKAKYIMFIDIVPFDNNRYKFSKGEWLASSKAEPHFNGL